MKNIFIFKLQELFCFFEVLSDSITTGYVSKQDVFIKIFSFLFLVDFFVETQIFISSYRKSKIVVQKYVTNRIQIILDISFFIHTLGSHNISRTVQLRSRITDSASISVLENTRSSPRIS